jgi:hypothetical protein
VALRDKRADERLVTALGDNQDAAGTPLHGGGVWRPRTQRGQTLEDGRGFYGVNLTVITSPSCIV